MKRKIAGNFRSFPVQVLVFNSECMFLFSWFLFLTKGIHALKVFIMSPSCCVGNLVEFGFSVNNQVDML